MGSFWDSQTDTQLLQRYHHTAVVHNRINMYIFGGMGPREGTSPISPWEPTNEFLEYNLESGEYHLLNSDIVQLTVHKEKTTYDGGVPKLPSLAQHSMVLVGADQLFIYGGRNEENKATNQMYRFDISNNHWYHLVYNSITKDNDFVPPSRYGHTAVTVDDSSIYIFGGTNGNSYFNDLYILNTETMQWTVATTQGTPPDPRAGHSCVLYGGEQMYIFGGGNDEKIFNDLYCLDINTLTWRRETIKGNIEPVKRTYHTASVIASKMILLGGNMSTSAVSVSNSTSFPNNFMIFDLETKRWDFGVIDSRPSQSPPLLYGHSAVLSGAKLWVIGGRNALVDADSSTDSVSQCVYTLDTGIQGIEPIDYGRSTLSYDLHSLVNARDMMPDVTFEFNKCFYYGHRPFLRVRCPILHKEYLKTAYANDSTLMINQIIEQLAMKRKKKTTTMLTTSTATAIASNGSTTAIVNNNGSTDFNGRTIRKGFSTKISAEVFESFLEYLYTDFCSIFEGGMDSEVMTRDLAFFAELFSMDRLYALCCQHCTSLESKQSNRQAVPSPELFNDMKKMFDLSQQFIPQIEESKMTSLDFDDLFERASQNSVTATNDNTDDEEDTLQTPLTMSSDLLTNLSANPQFTYCDIIFSVTCNDEHERIGAHRCVLISRSNFFHRMLSQHTHSNLELEITGIRPQVFKLVIEFLYTGNVTINFDVSVEMLIASEVYQLERLSLMCQGVIERRIHVHNVCRILNIADAYDIKHLRESCVYFIVHHLSQVKRTMPYRTELDIDLKKELKRKRKMYREQEGSGFYEQASDQLQFLGSAVDKKKTKKRKGSNSSSNGSGANSSSRIRKSKKDGDDEYNKAKKKKRRSKFVLGKEEDHHSSSIFTEQATESVSPSNGHSRMDDLDDNVGASLQRIDERNSSGVFSSLLDDLSSANPKRRRGRAKLKINQ